MDGKIDRKRLKEHRVLFPLRTASDLDYHGTLQHNSALLRARNRTGTKTVSAPLPPRLLRLASLIFHLPRRR